MLGRILNAIKTPVRKEYTFYYSIFFFVALASIYLYLKSTYYKISYDVRIEHPGISLDSVYAKIKSKALVQKTIDKLPFEVNYYFESAPNKEIYGNVLPLRLIFDQPVEKIYQKNLLINAVSSHSYSIDHEDTIQFYEIGENVRRYYGNFKVVKGPAFRSRFDPFIVRFNNSETIFNSFYKSLRIDSDKLKKNVVLSVIAANPLKGQNFLIELVKQYNAGNEQPGKAHNYQDSLKLTEKKLAFIKSSLKSTNVSKPDKQQLKTLEVIRPYIERPVTQFVQVPYTDEVKNKTLKEHLEKFNKAELEKQHFLAALKVDDVAVANADKELKLLRSAILDQISNKSTDLNEAHMLQQSALRYKKLIANQTVNESIKNIDSITLPAKDDVQIDITGVNFILVYIFAILLGLLLPMAFAFIINLDLTMIRSDWFNSQTLIEKLKILFGISQLD